MIVYPTLSTLACVLDEDIYITSNIDHMRAILKVLKQKFPIDHFFFHKSYSQEGEDLIYRSFFENRKGYKGFYVDVGAHHPYRFSNTLRVYKQGWNGINIEPMPDAIRLFNLFRKRDINLNLGIDNKEGTIPFYCFNEPALNTFSKEISEQKAINNRYYVKKILAIKTQPLAKVLDEFLPAGQTIDFLNIDAEGLDLSVLKSNNWDRYKPLFVFVEAPMKIQLIADCEISNYLIERGYTPVAKTMRTMFFKLNDPATH